MPVSWWKNRTEYHRLVTEKRLKNIPDGTWLAFHDGRIIATGNSFDEVDIKVYRMNLEDEEPYLVRHNTPLPIVKVGCT
jgi:hypothetical protein